MNIDFIKIKKRINYNVIAQIIWLIFFNEKLSACSSWLLRVLRSTFESINKLTERTCVVGVEVSLYSYN
jgi:hypothetical protein